MMNDSGRVPDGTGLSQVEPQEGLGPSGFDPSRGTVALRGQTLEEATMLAIMSATNATFNWRGQEDLTPLMAVNICAGVIAYLRAMPPGHSLEELAVAIESLKLALGRDSDGSGEAGETVGLDPKGDSAGRRHRPSPTPKGPQQ